MSQLSLRRVSWTTIVVFATVGLAIYLVAAVIAARAADDPLAISVLMQAVHDGLLLVSGVFLGASGLLGALRVWWSRRVAHRTGSVLLSLLTEVDALGAQLNALVWQHFQPHLPVFERLAADDVWALRGSEHNREITHRVASAALAALSDTGGSPDAAPAETADADLIAAVGETLHDRARELAAYEPSSASDLLTATALLRSLTRQFLVDRTHGGSTSLLLTKLGLEASEPLSTVARSVETAEAETIRILERSAAGRELLKPHLDVIEDRREAREFTAEFAASGRETQQASDAMDRELADLKQALRQTPGWDHDD